MGYYTRFALTLMPEHDEDIVAELRSFSEDALYGLTGAKGVFGSACKGYDLEKDLREFSKRYPDIVFKLSGEGAENDDIWDKYFKNGKMQECRAKVIMPQYDESKLV